MSEEQKRKSTLMESLAKRKRELAMLTLLSGAPMQPSEMDAPDEGGYTQEELSHENTGENQEDEIESILKNNAVSESEKQEMDEKYGQVNEENLARWESNREEIEAVRQDDRMSDIKRQKLDRRKKEAAEKKKQEEKQGGQEETGDLAAMLDRSVSASPALPVWINVKLGVSLWNYLFFRKQDAKSPLIPIIRPLQWKNLNPSLPIGVPLPNFVLHIIVLTIDILWIMGQVLQFLVIILGAAAPYLIAAGVIGAAAYGVSQAL